MKNLNITIITTFIILTFNACSPKTDVAPSQNEALNSITSSTVQKKNDGAMQKSLDKWLNDEWTPKTQKDKNIKAKDADKTRDFTLQEYVDKSEVYMKESKSNTKDTESHSKKMESIPVIGK
ncbi:hypothetical protein [Sulfurimonas sp.]|uniref:hypothetical protein n=1 Tax=Sulfurimonas sp. TaxID=2022749 RepID=UPI002AAFCD33|nr:hypothetical protein [Sulfurimonas sp.]